jgi:hypothetical protein
MSRLEEATMLMRFDPFRELDSLAQALASVPSS